MREMHDPLHVKRFVIPAVGSPSTIPESHLKELKAVHNDPIVQAMIKRKDECTQRGIGFFLRTPGDVIADHMIESAAALLAPISLAETPDVDNSRLMDPELRWAIYSSMRACRPVLWDINILSSVYDMKSPDGEVIRSRSEGVYFCYPSTIGVSPSGCDERNAFRRVVSDWYFCGMRTDGTLLSVHVVSLIKDSVHFSDNSLISVDALTVGQPTFGAPIHKMLAFYDSPYIPRVVERPDDLLPKRKRGTSSGRKQATFIQMRKIARSHDGVVSHASADAERVYHSRWIVRGHLRAQWYPSEKTHKTIYVPPYIKGPEGAEFVATAAKVMR